MNEIRSAQGPELTTVDLYALLRLRVQVFVVEQECAYAELDDHDLTPSTRHFWSVTDGEVVGCLRVLPEGNDQVRIGRVCTHPAVRGRGVASRLMTAALASIGRARAVLAAQVQATGFYARFGFAAEGDEFDEDGIAHIMMRRPPGQST